MSEFQHVPRKAVVLAAGMGQRLRPMTLYFPKPLMPLGGEPLIERSLRQLEGWGIRQIAVNLHWQAGTLHDYLEARPGPTRFIYSYEPRLRGTGGALQAFRDFLQDEPFWIVNADIVWQVAPGALLRAGRDGDALAALWLVPERGPRTVETAADGRITTFRSAHRGAPGTATFSGVQLVAPRLLKYLPDDPEQPVSLVELYEAAMRDGERVLGVTGGTRSVWDDAGTLPDYLRLRKRFRRKRRPTASWQPLALPFRAGADNEVWYEAAAWPEPALAPLLSDSPFPLAGTRVNPLPLRGSDRVFLRIKSGASTAIFVHYGTLREENMRYAGHARLLREAGLAVPRVLAESRGNRALLLEDVGKENLLDLQLRSPGETERLYRRTLDQVVLLHTNATQLARSRGLAMEPPFDRRLFDWERDLFLNQIVRNRHRADAAVNTKVIADYDRVAQVLQERGEGVVVHRDLQSTNIIFKGRRLSLIDFQGMRYGPAVYDLASLLCDPYAKLPPDLRKRLLDYYARRIGAKKGVVQRFFPFGAVQRLTQALGAYGRLTALGLDEWQRHIVPASALLAEMAGQCGLEAIRQLAIDTLQREQQGKF
jgi:mannose-1-phosphate guanylyltransferase